MWLLLKSNTSNDKSDVKSSRFTIEILLSDMINCVVSAGMPEGNPLNAEHVTLPTSQRQEVGQLPISRIHQHEERISVLIKKFAGKLMGLGIAL
jgi:hypothetical protein